MREKVLFFSTRIYTSSVGLGFLWPPCTGFWNFSEKGVYKVQREIFWKIRYNVRKGALPYNARCFHISERNYSEVQVTFLWDLTLFSGCSTSVDIKWPWNLTLNLSFDSIIFFYLTFWPLSFIGISYKRHCSGNGLRLFNFDLILWNLLERYKSKLSRYKPFSGFFLFFKFFFEGTSQKSIGTSDFGIE